jgi:hypothetical protein
MKKKEGTPRSSTKTPKFASALARSPDESVHLVRSTPSRKQRATVIGLKRKRVYVFPLKLLLLDPSLSWQMIGFNTINACI